MEPWRVCRWLQIRMTDKKPDPDPNQSEMLDPDPCLRDADPQHFILQCFFMHTPRAPLSYKTPLYTGSDPQVRNV